MTAVYVESIGLFAPGLVGWENSKNVLAGYVAYQFAPLLKYKPALLPANERRRASALVRLAFGACDDAVGERLEQASRLAAVFTASGGDYDISDQICRALLNDEKAVSPTQFHNSVHNAAAGYWSIAIKSQAPSVSLSAHDSSVSAGIIEAVTMVTAEQLSVLLVCSDNQSPLPIFKKRPIKQPFSAALWLSPEPSSNTIAELDITLLKDSGPATPTLNPTLEAMRADNPAAKLLPVLELLARGKGGFVQLSMAGAQALQVSLSPTATPQSYSSSNVQN